MSLSKPTSDQSRSRRGWLGGLAALGAAAAAVLFFGIRQRAEVNARLANHHDTLATVAARAEATAEAADRLIRTRALAALASAHPAVGTLIGSAGADAVELALLRTARGAAPGAHGAVVWSRTRGRGVLVVSPLPELAEDGTYLLTGWPASAEQPVPLVAFTNATTVEFGLPPGVELQRFEVARTPRAHAAGSDAEAVLVSVVDGI